MNQGLALLEALQPPPDYETRAALGTTYSADLVACMVAITSLDASSGEGADYRRISALRALDRQRESVRIAVHQGRIAWHGKHRRTLALLDRIVRPVAFDGNERAFHPKVWISRQAGPESTERWVLIIGSRNLTTSEAWDFGVTLIGSSVQPNKGRWKRLGGLASFARRVCTLFGEPGFASRFDGIDDVFWRLPDGCDDATLHVSPGDTLETPLDTAPPLALMKEAESVLILSPFLDSEMVVRAARACRSVEKLRLIAGARDLDKVSITGAQEALMNLAPHFIDVTDEEAIPAGVHSALEERRERGLHAKLVLAQRADRCTLLAGSHNLTSRAWGGANCEVSLALRVEPKLAQQLWAWSDTRAHPFEVREHPPSEEPSSELIDRLRNQLGATRFHLTDAVDKGESTLRAEALPKLDGDSGLELLVARLSRPNESVLWPMGNERIALPACLPAERTSFLILRLRVGGYEVAWVQNVEVSPPIDEIRDREAFVRILGSQGFLQYLRLVLGESPSEGEGQEDDRQEPPTSSSRAAARPQDLFRFEDILRRLCRPDSETLQAGPFHEAAKIVRQHRDTLMRSGLSAKEQETFDQFWKMWDAIEEGMQLP